MIHWETSDETGQIPYRVDTPKKSTFLLHIFSLGGPLRSLHPGAGLPGKGLGTEKE